MRQGEGSTCQKYHEFEDPGEACSLCETYDCYSFADYIRLCIQDSKICVRWEREEVSDCETCTEECILGVL